MNLTDLKQVLDERSDGSAEHVMHHVRLHSVRAKVVGRRRRRVAAWTACAVLAVVGTVATVVPGLRTEVRPAPATSLAPMRTIEGFPEYANGARVVAAKSAQLPQRSIELTFAPTTADLTFFHRCDDLSDDEAFYAKWSVNGHDLGKGTCGVSSTYAGLDEYLTLGEPANFVMTITGIQRNAGEEITVGPVPAAGSYGLAIGERIPFEEYPLPPRPSGSLAPLHGSLPFGCSQTTCPDALIIRSDPHDPTLRVRRTISWKTLDQIDMVAQTPGRLRLRINGVEITTGEWWNYGQGGVGMYGDVDNSWKDFGLKLSPGDPVTVEIVPEYISGAWQVVLTPVGARMGGE